MSHESLESLTKYKIKKTLRNIRLLGRMKNLRDRQTSSEQAIEKYL